MVANQLQTRKSQVHLVTAKEVTTIRMQDSEISGNQEIEEKIIEKIVQMHSDFCSNQSSCL